MSRSYTRKRKRHERHVRHKQDKRQRTLTRRAKTRTKAAKATGESW